MRTEITFILDGRCSTLNCQDGTPVTPTTTVLNYLRMLPAHKGVKEGCAEGDCGACTVVLGELHQDGTVRYKAVDSCLVFLPMLHGKHLVTVENLKTDDDCLHPVQQAMVATNGSQCGFCTPGFIMSLFSLYKNTQNPSRAEIDDALTGNLCRCTGYKPIVEAAARSCSRDGVDQFSRSEQEIAGMMKAIPRESLHLKTGSQDYFRPASLGEAITLKHRYPDAVVINGATDIALRVTKRHELLKEIIDLSALEELQQISAKDDALFIGAGVQLSDLMPQIRDGYAALHAILSVFGSLQIRNLATIGGNVGTASPIGDTLPVLMAYGARIVLEGLNGKREIPIDEYFTAYRKTVRKPDELITAVILPKHRPGTDVKAYKISRRKDLDISTVSAGFSRTLDGDGVVSSVILAYGGMAEKTARAANTERFLIGKKWERPVIEQAGAYIDRDFRPISDARSGAEMRSLAARNLLVKFWSETHHRNNSD